MCDLWGLRMVTLENHGQILSVGGSEFAGRDPHQSATKFEPQKYDLYIKPQLVHSITLNQLQICSDQEPEKNQGLVNWTGYQSTTSSYFNSCRRVDFYTKSDKNVAINENIFLGIKYPKSRTSSNKRVHYGATHRLLQKFTSKRFRDHWDAVQEPLWFGPLFAASLPVQVRNSQWKKMRALNKQWSRLKRMFGFQRYFKVKN